MSNSQPKSNYDPALLRSVLQSCQNGLPLATLNREHREITGEYIPYQQLGFRTLEAFLNSIPNIVQIVKTSDGELRVVAIPDEATRHIADLVARQRSNKSNRNKLKKSTRRPSSRPDAYFPRYNNYAYHTKPPWKPPMNNPFSLTCSGGARESTNRYSSKPPVTRSLSHESATKCSSPLQLSRSFVTKPHQESPSGDRRTNHEVHVNNKPLVNDFKPSSPLPMTRIPSRHATPSPTSPSRLLPTPVALAPTPTPSLVNKGRGRGRIESPSLFQRQLSLDENSYVGRKSYRQMLEDYVQRKNLGSLVFRTFPMFHDHRTVHMATVVVKDRTFSSYPDIAVTTQKAEELAAQRAITELDSIDKDYSEKKERRKVSSNLNNILIRVREIIELHPNGIIHTHVPKEYSDKYNEMLPEGWLELMEQNEMIKTQKIDATRIILYSFVEMANGSHPKSDASSSSESNASVARRNSEVEISLPDDDFMDVFVTYVMSSSDIAFRLVDHSEDYEEMANNMDLYFMEPPNCIHVDNPRGGHVYAAKVDESWHRVKVITVAPNDVFCSFVDHGDNDSISRTSVFNLPSKFHELPHQALHCQLTGLESYADNMEMLVILMELLVGKPLVAEINDRNNLSLTLYDTSMVNDVNINDKAIGRFAAILHKQHFQQVGDIFEGVLSHVTSDGAVYIQPKSDSLTSLMEGLEIVQSLCEQAPAASFTIVKDHLYMAKDPDDGKWQRAIVVTEDGDVAIKCYLHNLPPKDHEWTEEASKRLRQLAGDTVMIMVSTAGDGADSLPHVELLMRADERNLVVSINQSLAADTALFKKVEPVEETESPKVLTPVSETRAESPEKCLPSTTECITTALKPPELPNIGDFVDIDIVMVVSPWNFVCQPRSMGYEFDKLMEKMQDYYGKEENRIVMTSKDLKLGNMYACYHKTDELWYRVAMKSANSTKSSVCVYFMDFGDNMILPCSELYDLPVEFQELPYQAFFCKLSGIQPKNGDWIPEDCIRFQELVRTKAFSAMVLDKQLDSEDIIMLDVRLFDVSTEEDVDIGHSLVLEGRAVVSDDD